MRHSLRLTTFVVAMQVAQTPLWIWICLIQLPAAFVSRGFPGVTTGVQSPVSIKVSQIYGIRNHGNTNNC